MQSFTLLNPLSPRRLIAASAASWFALAGPTALRAATIQAGNVTTSLGPSFFLDEAVNGGVDTDLNQPNSAVLLRSFNGVLSPNQGPTRVVLTGFGFALHTSTTANDATSVAVAFTYLGADEVVGGSDDVVIGTATGNLNFTGGGEYVFAFDTPLTANLNVTGTRFRISITPSNATASGSLKIKSLSPSYAPYVSVAGVASSTVDPQRVNLAKYQTVTATSVAGQRLASYLTDGVTGNDNRWQGSSDVWQSVVVNFPFPVEVGSAQVFTGVDDGFPIGSYGLQFWNGTTWTNIDGGGVASGNTNIERNLVFTNPVTASSFRLMSAEGSLRVRELALYPPNGPAGYPLGTDLTVNLAYQRPATATANTAGNFALNAVDGRTHTGSFWQTSTAGTNTLDIDLRVPTKIGSAHIYTGSPGVLPLSDFVLKYWDGTAWQNIPGATVSGNATADLVDSFTPVTTTKVRLEFTNPGTASIRELCIFPANTGNTGYPLGTNIINSGAIGDYETYNDAFYLISHSASGRTMSVPNNGQPALDPGSLTFGQSQYQVLLNLSNGTCRLRNRASGNCLSGAQLSKTPGQLLIDAPYSALPHQDWILDPLGGGAFRFINQWSGLAIDTQSGATAAGTPLVQNTANGSTTQRWGISKYTVYPKKGIGHSALAQAFDIHWVYNWGRTNSQTLPASASFYPMQWGNYSWDIGSAQGPLWQEYPAWRKRADGVHLLGFNEPDRTDQSNIPQSTVLTLWPRIQEMDLPLASPSPGTIGGDGGWLDSFYTQADALGYRVDYTAVHTYPSPSGGSATNLMNFVTSAYTYNSRNRPVWLTEFSFVDWGGNQSWSEEDSYHCLAEFLWRAEGEDKLRKYALFIFTEDAENPQPANSYDNFTPAPRSNSYDINGSMTAFGKLYAAWDGDTTVRTNKTYYIHHKQFHKRLANNTSTTNLAGRNIRVEGDLVHWQLVSAGPANRYYVVSSLDGRRLSSNGTAASYAAAGTTGTAVEWSLTPTQHGWHYLVHTATNTRLQLTSFTGSNNFSSFSMAASTVTSDAVQWRFIVPVEANSAPVLAAIPSQTVQEGTQLTFTATATDSLVPAGALIYSLVGAPSGASINSTTGAFTWTPSLSQGPGVFNFTVRASDGRLAQNLPVTVTVSEVSGANVAPVLASIPPRTVNEGSLLTFTASATDDGLPSNTLAYSLVGAPSGASINPSTGVFTWTPTEAQGPGSFNFTVRVSDGNLTHDQPATVTVTDDGGADHLGTWIVSGQSNAEGYGITESPVPGLAPASTLASIGRSNLNVIHNNIQMFQGANDSNGSITASAGLPLPPRNTWHAMTAYEGLAYDWGSGRGNESGRRFGPELAFGYDVQMQLGSSIALIKYARGSSSIAPSADQSGDAWRDFDPSDDRLNQYDKLVSTIQAAVNNLPAGQVLKMRGVVWMQGESDATATNAPAYQANLTELIAALRADIGAIAAASGGRMTRSAASWGELDVFVGTVRNTTAFRQTVINAQNAVAAADPNVFIVDGTNDLSVMTVDDWGASGVHYDTAGQVLLGERFADAAISRIDSGVLVSESGGVTSVTEGAATDTYTVTLTRAPSADVTINITTDSQVSVSPASLTYTSGNWATPQTVTVTAVNDAVVESNHSGSISHGLSSTDLSFGGLPINGVTATVIDNDVNTAPVLAAIPPQTVDQGTLLTFTASATDTDLPANTLAYSLIGAPAGASINPGTGIFTWTPTAAQGPGSFNFSTRVSDGNLTHDQPVSVTVESPLPSPEVDTDGDGLSDLLEYAFVTDPGIPNANPFRINSANDSTVTLAFPWNWQAAGITWQIRHGQDLSNIAIWPVVAPGPTTITREGDIDRITATPAMAYPDRGFYILEVIGN